MKAIDKERERRYGSASELADDIDRHLAGQPVMACPPSTIYRTRKLIRRHRVALLATSFVVASMVAGTGFSIWYSFQAKSAQLRAEKSESLANQKHRLLETEQRKLREQQVLLRLEKDKLAQAQQISEENYQLATDAVTELIDRVANNKVLAYPELADFRGELLTSAEEFYSQLIARDARDHQLFLLRARVRRNLHKSADALADLKNAESLAPDSKAVHRELAEFYRMAFDYWSRNPTLALKHAKRLIEIDSNSQAGWYTLAWIHRDGGETDQAVEAMKHAAELSDDPYQRATRLGIALFWEGKFSEAATQYQQAQPDGKMHLLNRLGECYYEMGELERAVEIFSKSIQVNAFHAVAPAGRAAAKLKLGRHLDAADDWELAYDIDPNDFWYLPKIRDALLKADTHQRAIEFLDRRTGKAEVDKGLMDRATADRIRSIGVPELSHAADRLVDRIIEHHRDQGEFSRLKDYLCRVLGEPERALSVFKDLIEEDGYQASAELFGYRGVIKHSYLKQPEGAVPDFEKAIEIQPDAAHPHGRLALALMDLHQPERAFAEASRAIELYHPDTPHWLWQLLAMAAGKNGDYRSALSIAMKFGEGKVNRDDGWAFLRILQALAGEDEAYRKSCKGILTRWGKESGLSPKHIDVFTLTLLPGAIADYEDAIAEARSLVNTEPGNPVFIQVLGAMMLRAGLYQEAEDLLREATQLHAQTSIDAPYGYFLLAITHCRLGQREKAKESLAAGDEATQRLREVDHSADTASVLNTWFMSGVTDQCREEAEKEFRSRFGSSSESDQKTTVANVEAS
ncbi:tetratricopeptide repeat protein [Roseiconus nitratireducens]|nr:tetratricopeptide repeat protein [Roseiconus nitratireducens]